MTEKSDQFMAAETEGEDRKGRERERERRAYIQSPVFFSSASSPAFSHFPNLPSCLGFHQGINPVMTLTPSGPKSPTPPHMSTAFGTKPSTPKPSGTEIFYLNYTAFYIKTSVPK